MNLVGKRPTFHRSGPRSNPYRILLWLVLIAAGLLVFRGMRVTHQIKSPFDPTPTPTRTSNSYAQEAEAQFVAGNLGASIQAYQQATLHDPQNAQLWTDLARVQVYASNLETSNESQLAVLQDALNSIDQAKELAPDDSTVAATRAFALDWYATALASDKTKADEVQRLLNDAETEATRSLSLDNTNTLALAYYAEILVDQQKWTRAQQLIDQAYQRNPNLMDVRRVRGLVFESQGDYRNAISEYDAALKINPNLTFLYINIGVIYRHLQLYDQSLEYFQRAVDLNKQLGIRDPIPYIGISKTYSQQGEFYIAGLNVIKALQLDPYSADVYGQLGIVLYHSKNYEGSIPAFQCALEGCTAQESCEVRDCNVDTDPQVAIQGLKLDDTTVVYYYTYGSVLAGLHIAGDDKCDHAMRIFQQLRQVYSNDSITMTIVQAGEKICSNSGPALETTTPETSQTPGAAQITSTPEPQSTPDLIKPSPTPGY